MPVSFYERFDSVLYAVCQPFRDILFSLPLSVKSETEEIRLRTNKAISLTIGGQSFFVEKSGNLTFLPTKNSVRLTADDMEKCFKLLVKNSVYSHMDEIEKGYVAMQFGCRAGICGTYAEGNMRDISSVNIRIAKEVFGCADRLVKNFSGGILIAGPPCSGKTTVLRDFIRQISCGILGKSYRIAVVDSRGEISASYQGQSANDLGENTDILVGYKKAQGLEMAVRTLFPQIVAFDELGSEDELLEVENCFNCGVDIITTAHIGSIRELAGRQLTKKLILCGAIKTVAFLSFKAQRQMEIYSIEQVKELCGL